MWRIRVPILIAAAWTESGRGAPQVPGSQQKEIAPLTVVSVSERRWASSVGLRVLVRDVNQPDLPIPDAQVRVERTNARTASPLAATSDGAGVASVAAPDSGEYYIRVLRVGYTPLQFRVRLEVDCAHVLEAYISSPDPISDPLYTAGKLPKRTRFTIQTTGRAVLTTCPPAA